METLFSRGDTGQAIRFCVREAGGEFSLSWSEGISEVDFLAVESVGCNLWGISTAWYPHHEVSSIRMRAVWSSSIGR